MFMANTAHNGDSSDLSTTPPDALPQTTVGDADFLTELYAPQACDFPRFPQTVQRRKTTQLMVGNVAIGGNAPISVQSMLVNDTRDVKESIYQIQRLADAGCEIIRLAVPDKEAAEALKIIVPKSPIPVVADIHFDYRLALQAADNGVHAIRINPGNLSSKEFVKAVVRKCKERQLPIRIGLMVVR